MSAKRKTNKKPEGSWNNAADQSGQKSGWARVRTKSSGVDVWSWSRTALPGAGGGPSAATEDPRDVLAPETGPNERWTYGKPLGRLLGKVVKPGSMMFRTVYEHAPAFAFAEWCHQGPLDPLTRSVMRWKSFVRGEVDNLCDMRLLHTR